MRMKALLLAFFPQCQPLVDAKAVLLIDNDQRQPVKLHLFLKDSVGADNHLHLTAGNSLLLRLTRFTFLLTGQPTHFNAQRFEPVAEIICVLFSQQFGRRHQRHLLTVGNSAQGGKRRNQRFTGTHVALNQTHHRHIQRHITFDLCYHPRLRAGGFKRQRRQQLVFQYVVGT
ncbi:Uncharacterised protein [Salmonella enterica subsp. enterica serovar Bovismorbificans]|uniref:Uncharacterized protein n=1 Tax=Salmonella enterica subsp. enterica serovar Bovismorbificans TaxID=58097 RepID=A0A655CG14_SALET|nr:Uncharacterised protein [Salmonella enterica subsp. enterica serovar Bovismorbificans]